MGGGKKVTRNMVIDFRRCFNEAGKLAWGWGSGEGTMERTRVDGRVMGVWRRYQRKKRSVLSGLQEDAGGPS